MNVTKYGANPVTRVLVKHIDEVLDYEHTPTRSHKFNETIRYIGYFAARGARLSVSTRTPEYDCVGNGERIAVLST